MEIRPLNNYGKTIKSNVVQVITAVALVFNSLEKFV